MIDDMKGDPLWTLMGLLFRAHPWHGVPIGVNAPERVTAYIEITTTDTVKYELDKGTGLLRIDRPQRYSNVCPALYGLIPRTLCSENVARYCEQQTGRSAMVGDGDAMDICVLTEKNLFHGDVVVEAIPIGGLRMIDGKEADDKIVAVLAGDATYGGYKDISEVPPQIVDRLRHYFLTYKNAPDSPKKETEITHVYGREEAHEVIRRSHNDYQKRYPLLAAFLAASRAGV